MREDADVLSHREDGNRNRVFAYSFTEHMLVSINLMLASGLWAAGGAASNAHGETGEVVSVRKKQHVGDVTGKLGWTGGRGSRIETKDKSQDKCDNRGSESESNWKAIKVFKMGSDPVKRGLRGGD